MDNKTFYSRTVQFRDEDKNSFKIEIRLSRENTGGKGIHYETLQPVPEVIRFSASGDWGGGCGQCQDHIKPRTVGQKRLLRMWNEYHMNDLRSGTKAQSDYINSEQYKEDYNAFVEFYKWSDDKSRREPDAMLVTLWMQQRYGANGDYALPRSVIYNNMDGYAVKYILGLENDKFHNNPPHGLHDYYTRCFFLAIRGLLTDRGYTYGKKWLVNPLPDDIEKQIDDLCDLIEEEEAELTEQLEAVFDMGAKDFKPAEEHLSKVMELRDCDETEARRFIALGMFIGCTVGDLNDTFEEIDENRYSANGTEYYVGTDEELEAVAQGMLDDGIYDDLWKAAVQGDQTTLGLDDWLKQVIDIDGWCPIINTWDGRYEEYNVAGEFVCVCRS